MSRVLVVADDPWVRNEVHAALGVDGIDLIDHDDPTTAASAMESESVDVAIVDLQMTSMGGVAVTRAIRDREHPVPVILLLDREADEFLAGRSGAGAWVTKPFTASALRATVTDVTGAS